MTICGIAAVLTSGADDDGGNHEGALVEQLVEDATRDGADLALLFRRELVVFLCQTASTVVPTTDVELPVADSARHGAPMTLVRGGEDRDGSDRRHGAGPRGASSDSTSIETSISSSMRSPEGDCSRDSGRWRPSAHFVIAEEGITAAAYIVISVAGDTWTIEECGDRDSSGARVGALLQALIAREPVESRPVIRGWLPPGFLPPRSPSHLPASAPPLLLVRALSSRVPGLHLSAPDVMYLAQRPVLDVFLSATARD